MKKVVLMIGGCQYNRGSEAMVRGCIKTLRSRNSDVYLILSSRDDNTGHSLNIEGVDKYIKRFTYNRNNKFIRYPIGVLRYILHMKHFTNWINHYTLLNECRDADLVIVIGGDNYDKAYGAFDDMHSFHRTLKKIITGKMIFLNCSINPDEIDDRIINDLKLFDKVTAREQITYKELKKYLPNDKLEYYPDIAFAMELKQVALPKIFCDNDVVGLNLSPLILRKVYTDKSEIVLQEYESIIEYVINVMKKKVLLIPHVMNDADLSILRMLYQKYTNDNRVQLLDNEKLTSPELKYIISNCYMFFGARTHSTIAAYGTCVPTLVLGYSVKSIGIARDIFGTEETHVVSVQSISQSGKLLESFKLLVHNRENIRNTLHSVIPEYLRKADKYSIFFDKLIGDSNVESK